MLNTLARVLKPFGTVGRVSKSLRVRVKYNAYNIAELFREQGAQIGDDCFLGITSLAAEPFLVRIGNHVGIASGVKLLTHGLGWTFRDRVPDIQTFGTIVIEDNCNIGVDAIILPNVTIGRDSVVGAGAVVTKDVPPNSIVAGNPARVIGSTEDYFGRIDAKWALQRPPAYAPELRSGRKLTAREFGAIRARPENRRLLREHLTRLFWDDDRSQT